MFEKNEEDVEKETTENVDEQVTEELVEGANVTTEENTEEKEESEEKTYSEADFEKAVNDRVNKILPSKIERAKSRLERDNADRMSKYERMEDILKAGLKTNDTDETIKRLYDFYSEQGVEIPQESKYSARQMELLANAEAQEIIDSGYEEIVIETDRLAQKGTNNMTKLEKIIFQRLAEERKRQESMQELNKIGVDAKELDNQEYKEFTKKLNPNMSEKDKYELYLKFNPKKEYKQIGSLSSGEKTKEKDYYTSEEIDKLTDEELSNDKIWKRVRESMTKWKKD